MYPFRFIVSNIPFSMLAYPFYQHCASLPNASKPARFFDADIKQAYAKNISSKDYGYI